MKFRYIYKITCTKGSFKDKFYFGQHTTDNLDDEYKGSGKLITKYYSKYPNDYIKEIICFCDTDEELDKLEYNIIHPYLGTKMCLNLCEGGCQHLGSKCHSCHKHTLETREILRQKSIGNTSHLGFKNTPEQCEHIRIGRSKGYTEESKKKQSESMKGKIPYNKGLKDYLTSEQHLRMSLGHTRKITPEELEKRSKSLKGKNKGKHKVWNDDNDHSKGFKMIK